MPRKLLAVFFIFAFLNFTLLPNYAFALTPEEQAEADAKQARMNAALFGLALMVYIGSTLGKHNYSNLEHKSLAQKQGIFNQLPFNFKVGLDFSKSGFYYGSKNNPSMESKTDFRSPFLIMNVNW